MISLIQIILTLMIIYQMYCFFKNIVRYGINMFKNQDSIFIYRGEYKKGMQLCAVAIIIMTIIIYKIALIRIYFNYLFMRSINEFINYEIKGILPILLILCGAITINNFLLKEIVDIKLYKGGILYSDGRFIVWNDIKLIEYKKTYLGKGKKIIITFDNKKKIYLKNNNRNKEKFEELKTIVFEKSGIIFKEIVRV